MDLYTPDIPTGTVNIHDYHSLRGMWTLDTSTGSIATCTNNTLRHMQHTETPQGLYIPNMKDGTSHNALWYPHIFPMDIVPHIDCSLT